MKETTYNGWSNYETWCADLWLTNDEGSSAMLDQIIAEAKQAGHKSQAMDTLKDLIEDGSPEIGANMYSDMLATALGRIDWHEIVSAHWDDR